MSAFQTEATVLRRVDFRESDRMVTLFSPTHGRLEALARGCKKPAGTMALATELFATGTYQLFQKGERLTVTGFALREGFYPLRTEVERLAYGCYALGLCLVAIQPDAPEPELYAALRHALALLAYDACSEQAVAACFLMAFAACVGIQPELAMCACCGRAVEGRAVFDAAAGGVACLNCAPRGMELPGEALAWLRDVAENGFAACARARAVGEAFGVLRGHVEYHLEGSVKAGGFLSSLG